MGRTITEAKLADYVQFIIERYRKDDATMDIMIRVSANAVTADGEIVKFYNFNDLMDRLPPARAAAMRTAILTLIDDIATRLGVASS